MSEATFIKLFIAVWLCAMAYALSALKLALRVRHLKRQGLAAEAPEVFHPFDGVRGIFWLVTGRYDELNDPIVTRWAGVARVLFILVFPMVLILFAIAGSQMGHWSQPT
ncbi:MAG: hypothetical protein ACK4JY_04315 [Brevundimonas sp.]|uniref:hypothetical protein n=1 Tax=Brevundimonas sp. TaxID=1871086 RepID=UPI00391AFB80